MLGLFLELLLIRLIGTEIRIFSYLQNTVLVVCFMGLGMGCWTCRRPVFLGQILIPLLILLGLLVFTPISETSAMLSVLHDFVIWYPSFEKSSTETLMSVAMGLTLSLVVILLVWFAFVPIGRLLGRLLEDDPRTIWAYSLNLVGSLVGIWLFVLLSVSSTARGLVCRFALMIFLLGVGSWRANLSQFVLLAGIVGCAWWAGQEPGGLETIWSPYQKLTLLKAPAGSFGLYHVKVNNVVFQGIIDLRPETIQRDERMFRRR